MKPLPGNMSRFVGSHIISSEKLVPVPFYSPVISTFPAVFIAENSLKRVIDFPPTVIIRKSLGIARIVADTQIYQLHPLFMGISTPRYWRGRRWRGLPWQWCFWGYILNFRGFPAPPISNGAEKPPEQPPFPGGHGVRLFGTGSDNALRHRAELQHFAITGDGTPDNAFQGEHSFSLECPQLGYDSSRASVEYDLFSVA